VVTRGDVTRKTSVALGVSRKSDEVGLSVGSGGHVGWAWPSRPCEMRRPQKAYVIREVDIQLVGGSQAVGMV
jgi:hypothetical protein